MSAPTDGTTDFPVSVALGGGRRQEVRIGRHTTWDQFRQRVHLAFSLPAGAVTYVDEEGDKVSLDSEEEFKEAVKVGLKLGKLKLNIADTKASQYRPPRISPQPAKGHYSDLARTLGEEKKKKKETSAAEEPTTTFTDSPASPEPNPYIAAFVRSMSQEAPTKGGAKKSPALSTDKTKQPSSYVESHVHPSSEGTEGAPVKRRRVNGGGTHTTSKGYRRAFRPAQAPVHVEGVRQNLEAMKISPGAHANPYVEKLDRKLQECYSERPAPRALSSSCPKLDDGLHSRFHNQYIVGYHQKLLKTRHVCQASRPNCYVAQLHRSLSEDHVTKRKSDHEADMVILDTL
jgi:hypothetical protein